MNVGDALVIRVAADDRGDVLVNEVARVDIKLIEVAPCVTFDDNVLAA